MDKNPAVILGAITTLVVAVLAALVAFGMDISDAKQSAILAILAAVAPIVLGIVTRGKVYAPANVVAAVSPDPQRTVVAGPAASVDVGVPVAVVPVTG